MHDGTALPRGFRSVKSAAAAEGDSPVVPRSGEGGVGGTPLVLVHRGTPRRLLPGWLDTPPPVWRPRALQATVGISAVAGAPARPHGPCRACAAAAAAARDRLHGQRWAPPLLPPPSRPLFPLRRPDEARPPRGAELHRAPHPTGAVSPSPPIPQSGWGGCWERGRAPTPVGIPLRWQPGLALGTPGLLACHHHGGLGPLHRRGTPPTPSQPARSRKTGDAETPAVWVLGWEGRGRGRGRAGWQHVSGRRGIRLHAAA